MASYDTTSRRREGVQTRQCWFFSDGFRLEGLLQLPEGVPPDGGWPVVLLGSGFQGLKELIPARFWGPFTTQATPASPSITAVSAPASGNEVASFR
jgi:hypothetical protein